MIKTLLNTLLCKEQRKYMSMIFPSKAKRLDNFKLIFLKVNHNELKRHSYQLAIGLTT